MESKIGNIYEFWNPEQAIQEFWNPEQVIQEFWNPEQAIWKVLKFFVQSYEVPTALDTTEYKQALLRLWSKLSYDF